MNLKNILLSETSQTQKSKYCMIHLHEVSSIGKFTETERRTEITKGWAAGEEAVTVNISVWDDGKPGNGWWWWWLHNIVNALNATEL